MKIPAKHLKQVPIVWARNFEEGLELIINALREGTPVEVHFARSSNTHVLGKPKSGQIPQLHPDLTKSTRAYARALVYHPEGADVMHILYGRTPEDNVRAQRPGDFFGYNGQLLRVERQTDVFCRADIYRDGGKGGPPAVKKYLIGGPSHTTPDTYYSTLLRLVEQLLLAYGLDPKTAKPTNIKFFKPLSPRGFL